MFFVEICLKCTNSRAQFDHCVQSDVKVEGLKAYHYHVETASSSTYPIGLERDSEIWAYMISL